MPQFGPPDKDVRLPVDPKYPRDLDALVPIERRVAEGMSDYGAVMEAIRVVNPSPAYAMPSRIAG